MCDSLALHYIFHGINCGKAVLFENKQIIVLNEGKIIEKGKHEELIQNKQVYFTLWQNYEKAGQWNLETKELRTNHE